MRISQIKRTVILDFLIPLFILGCLTAAFWLTTLDTKIEECFYSPEKGWFLKESNPWDFLYHYGNIPAFTMAGVCLVVLCASLTSKRFSRYKKIPIFLLLVLAIGPGIITHSIFKENWGRPRPKHIVDFGGTERFLPVWAKGTSGKGKSFPSGHASVGYYTFTPFFFLRRINGKYALLVLFAGLGYGTLMGLGRMIQGAHFASDILWSVGFTYLTGLVLYYLFRFDRTIWWETGNRQRAEVSLKADLEVHTH